MLSTSDNLSDLIKRNRVLEKQRDLLAQAVSRDLVCGWCWLSDDCPHYEEDCAKRVIEWVEEATKEKEDPTDD